MARQAGSTAILVYLAVAVCLLFLLLLSTSPASGPTRRPHRRLKLRSNSTSVRNSGARKFQFDPVIADIERRFDDLDWKRLYTNISAYVGHAPAMEAAPSWEDAEEAEDYINDESRFNVSGRIEELFPKIDVEPMDGAVTVEELIEWNLAQSRREALHRARRDLALHDKNKDGLLAFEEYQRPSWDWRFDDNSTNDGVGWWKQDHFNASDIDGDGFLNVTEFSDFLHPADSSNPKLIKWLCDQEIRERDKDNDGRLSFQEFFNGLFFLLQRSDDEYTAHDGSNPRESSAKQLFLRLDHNNDGFLNADDLKAIIDVVHPSERFYAKQQAEYVVSQADSNKDGKLSKQEMIDNPYVFYSAIFTDDDEDSYFHDEFR